MFEEFSKYFHNPDVIRCTVCNRVRSRLWYPGKKFDDWAIGIEVPDPQPGEPEIVNLCPRHKKAVRNQIINDRGGHTATAEEVTEEIRKRINDASKN